MTRGRITPTFQLLTVKGKEMQAALMMGLTALERPQGEPCNPHVTDSSIGIVVSVERQRKVPAHPRWSVAADLDPYDGDLYKYRTVMDWKPKPTSFVEFKTFSQRRKCCGYD